MNISLDQAIEIHARVLNQWNHKAPSCARATALKRVGDHAGHATWLSVAATAESLLNEVQNPPVRASPTGSVANL